MWSVGRGENPADIIIKTEAPDINAADDDGRTALFWAQHAANYDGMRTLIKFGADMNIKDRWGETILSYAAKEGDLEAVKLLVDSKADVNAKNRHETTILMQAVQSKSLAIVSFLIKSGADVTAVDSASWDLPLFARRYGTPQIEQYIEEQLRLQTPKVVQSSVSTPIKNVGTR